ncbi:MAG: enoyl-CoA hydratase/isomerase family protein [Proteobacteria bacterium]|nr:enoyl-CoA hydratase/isomerase family protein [Pseudomonadota bacterium]
MTDYQKPIPAIQPWTREFWNATKQGKLLIQKCQDCHSMIFFPKKVCPECWSDNLCWQEASGKAQVYTYTTQMDMVEPKFRADLPYVIAMVDLEEGIRMTTRIVNCNPEDVTIGMNVHVVFEDISPECSLPMFQPADETLRRLPPCIDECESLATRSGSPVSPDTYETIIYDIGGKNGAVCTITLNRPSKYNAINYRMAAELIDAFRRVRDESSVGVVVLTGAGEKAFCTGGDLEIFPSLCEHKSSLNWLSHEGLDVQRAISGCEKVVICKINGHCLAGGLELALSCDLIYARESAMMGATEINMGLLPGWGGTARLPRSMPIFRAREIIFSGRKDYPAKDMYDMGLLTRVFKDDEFEEQVETVVKNIASKKPEALRMGKEIMARSVDGCDIETALSVERNGIQWLTYAPDVQKMMEGFRQKPSDLLARQKETNLRSDNK